MSKCWSVKMLRVHPVTSWLSHFEKENSSGYHGSSMLYRGECIVGYRDAWAFQALGAGRISGLVPELVQGPTYLRQKPGCMTIHHPLPVLPHQITHQVCWFSVQNLSSFITHTFLAIAFIYVSFSHKNWDLFCLTLMPAFPPPQPV